MTKWFVLFLVLALTGFCLAQSESATLSGRVSDSSGAAIVGAEVVLTNTQTNVEQRTKTNGVGLYVFAGVHPGTYRVAAGATGFRVLIKEGLTLHVQDELAENFSLTLGAISESITVTADATPINTTDASVSTIVDRQFVENMPLNGRSFQALIQLTPGVTAVPGASSGMSGEFSVNGQRTETNYYTVDGVSANTGMSDLNRGGGGTPAVTAIGTTQAMVSVDDLQEFRISTSSYSAEYGRSPGAQISFQTRSGTNTWHGSAYEYLRNGALDANNWFNDAANLPKPTERQNDFGGTVGGPVEIPGLYNGKDRTFFFFSYEGLRLTIPQAATTVDVPDTQLRQMAPTAIQPIVNAFPIPNGADQGNGLALFTGSYSSPSSLDSYSLRLDHTFGQKLTIFGRYADVPSESVTRALPYDFSNHINQSYDAKTATFGAASVLSRSLVNEFRLNYTSNKNRQVYATDNFGGATPVTPAQFAPGITLPQGYDLGAFVELGTVPGVQVADIYQPQHQWNVTDSMTAALGAHTLKYGFDYRKLVGTQNAESLVNAYLYFSSADILANGGLGVVQSFGPGSTGLFTNFSAFVQDEWKVTSRLHLSLGLRWDLNPPPSAAHNPQPYTLDQTTNLATAQLAPAGTPVYHTDYRGFGPRIGAAYQLNSKPDHQTVLRTGFGVFYDVGNYGALFGLFGGVGIGGLAIYAPTPFPLTPSQQTLPPPSTVSPYTVSVMAVDPHLRLPYTLQWNASIEQGLGSKQALTLSYVGAGGRKLLHSEYDNLAGINPNFALGNGLYLTTGTSTSGYNAMQAQFQRQLSRGLQVLASYTWSHSIDDLSSNQTLYANLLRASSDFDVRHNFAAAVTYDLPSGYSSRTSRSLLGHWEVDFRESARSALPVDIYYGLGVIGDGQTVQTRPDLVPGVPVYLYGSQYPGGKAVNSTPGAVLGGCPDGSLSVGPFCPPPAGQVGNAPRNFVRGFNMWQTDLAIRREFPIHERLKLQFRAESFNLLNHPTFGTIDNSISDGPALFGRAKSTLNGSLGGLNPLYQVGGPRSLQLALKLVF